MVLKNFPMSTYHVIDVIASMLATKMFTFGEKRLMLNNDDGNLDDFLKMCELGAFVIETQVDEVGETRFTIGADVVHRASGIFATVYKLVGIDGEFAVLKDPNSDAELRAHLACIREDGVGFFPSNTPKNDVDISGAPLCDADMLCVLMHSLVGSGTSSAGWTEMRFLSETTQGSEEEKVNYYNEICEWVVDKSNSKVFQSFNNGDIVMETLASQIVTGSYIIGQPGFIGRVQGTKTGSDSISRLYVTSHDGSSRTLASWQLLKLVDNTKIYFPK